MPALKTAVLIAWIAFGAYWLLSALGAKEALGSQRGISPARIVIAITVVVLFRASGGNRLAIDSAALEVVGAAILAAGLALAVWARLHIGRNWGMPTTQKIEPELITSGPYRFVRHPIYTGILVALLGTALATNLLGLVVVAILGCYFGYSATVEERNLTATFPAAYPAYKARTKMLIPFLL